MMYEKAINKLKVRIDLNISTEDEKHLYEVLTSNRTEKDLERFLERESDYRLMVMQLSR